MRQYRNGRARGVGDCGEEFEDVRVFHGDAAGGPVCGGDFVPRAVFGAVQEDEAAQGGAVRGIRFAGDGGYNRVVLRAGDAPVLKASVGVIFIWIRDVKAFSETGTRVFDQVVLALGRAAVAAFFLGAFGDRAECDGIFFKQRAAVEPADFFLRFIDDKMR